MSIESLAGMFSQRSGADQSMGSSVMSAIVEFLAQKMMGGGGGGIGSMLSGITGGGSSGSGGGIGSILSSIGGLNKDHELVRQCTTKYRYTRPRTGQTIYTAWS
jgi:hypothetical protein